MMSAATHKPKKLQSQAPLCLTIKEESAGNNQNGDIFYIELLRLLSSNTASSALDQNHHQTFRPTLMPPPPPPSTNITLEIIDVMVPRKAPSGHTHSQNRCCIASQIRNLESTPFFSLILFWRFVQLA